MNLMPTRLRITADVLAGLAIGVAAAVLVSAVIRAITEGAR